MDEKLEKEVKKEILKFELFLGDINNKKVEVVKPYEDKNLFVLTCGHVSQFKFPEGSTNPKFRNMGQNKRLNMNIQMTFDYNNREYQIRGFI
ncbi:MAG: hypothetical protein AABY32_00450 [Nanoarchaeota archaeon]